MSRRPAGVNYSHNPEMASIAYGSPQITIHLPHNQVVADLQSFAHRQFSTGQGFFLTLGGAEGQQGETTTNSYWLHPSIPISFQYDVVDNRDEYIEPAQIDPEKLDRWADASQDALGIALGFPEHGAKVPFEPVEPASTSPVVGEDAELPAEERF